MRTIELNLGIFNGFYHSFIEDDIDRIVDDELNELGIEYDDAEINYDFKGIARELFYYAKANYLDEIPFISKAQLKELWSPEYYNYSNDKIYYDCVIDTDGFKKWFTELIAEGGNIWEEMRERIVDAHTSCSGFVSFHSNKVKDWIVDLMELDLDNDKTIYKLGFIIDTFIECSQLEDNSDWQFELAFLEDNSGELYQYIEVKKLEDAD